MPRPPRNPNDPPWVEGRELWINGWSQNEMAEKLGVTQQAISLAAKQFVEDGDWPKRTLAYDVDE